MLWVHAAQMPRGIAHCLLVPLLAKLSAGPAPPISWPLLCTMRIMNACTCNQHTAPLHACPSFQGPYLGPAVDPARVHPPH